MIQLSTLEFNATLQTTQYLYWILFSNVVFWRLVDGHFKDVPVPYSFDKTLISVDGKHIATCYLILGSSISYRSQLAVFSFRQ